MPSCARAARVSVAATLRGMARSAEGKLALVEMKAVDDTYPMLGTVDAGAATAARPICSRSVTAHSAPPPIRRLLARLSLKIGDRVTIGSATFQIRSSVEAEPDKLAGGIGFGPRFLISEAALRATGLIQPGSLVRWIYRVKLPDTANSDRATDALHRGRRATPRRRPAGRSARRSNASPQLERNISRFTQFLTLVGLDRTAGRRRRRRQCREEPSSTAGSRSIATLKAVGATGARRVRHLSRAGRPARGDRHR